jgi:uncharacterized protein DUF1553
MRPPGVMLPDNAPELPLETSNPRTMLAKWAIDPQNPLTARVMVNRIWEYHFGRGIVATPNDFGRMGERPTHPELLDYLANEFVSSGYSVKHIHRLILLSHAYQQSSAIPEKSIALERDSDNKLLWRFNRRRLDAEELRDAMLAVAGNLNFDAGGQSVIVPIEKELVSALYKPSQWQVTADAARHNSRSVYLIAKRNLRLPFLEVFDAPDTLVSCPRRESSTHAPQASPTVRRKCWRCAWWLNPAVLFVSRLIWLTDWQWAVRQRSVSCSLGWRFCVKNRSAPARKRRARNFRSRCST